MKTLTLAATAVAAFGLSALSTPSRAADGLINFNGQITAQTCDISGNGGGVDFTVTLPTVSQQTLSTAGQWAGRTPFNIALSNCSPATGNVAVYFEPGSTVDLRTGQLLNDTGDGQATNVELQLLNQDTTAITLWAADLAATNSKSVALEDGAATLNYYVQYVAVNGASTDGLVASRINYTIAYE